MTCTGKQKIALLIAVVLLACAVHPAVAYAETTQEKLEQAQQEKKETEQQLNQSKEDLEDLKEESETLKGALNTLNAQLTAVSDNIADLEQQITDKEAEIEATNLELEEARATEEAQYAAMKKRVQFIYEKQSSALLEMFFKAKSFGDFLNQSNYVADLSAYDRKMLDQYQQTKTEIAQKEADLEKEMSDLNEYQTKQQAEQSRVSGLVSQTSGSISRYSSQISDAQKQAEAIEDDITQQDADIKALQAKLAEEIRMSKLAAQSSWRDISEVTFADGDRYLLANLIYCEAGGEPYEGKLAVGSVVINRVLSSVYPDTVVGVIYQNKQFSPVASGRLALALAEGRATDSCYQAADQAMSGVTNVGECVYFRTPIDGLTGINIGGHVFY